MKKPEISVVMPAYKCANTICAAIDSALMQDVDLEVIVINDCSPDHLDAVMERYRENPAVVYVHNERNLGAADTRNRGIALAKAEFVAFLDSDDCWRQGKLRKQLDQLRESGAVLSCTARELMTPEGALTGRVIPVKGEISYRELLKHNSISCSSVLIRREAALAFPMEHPDSHEDYITWLKVLRKFGPAAGINEPLLVYRLSTTGKSGNKLKSAKMTFRVYRYMDFGPVKSAVCFCSYALHGVGKYLLSYRKK